MGSYAYSIQQAQVDGEQCFEVFSLFDMLVHAVDDKDYCVIALVNHGLCEEVDDEHLPVLGRACGDRVCVVDARYATSASDSNNTTTSKSCKTNPVSVSQNDAKRTLRTLLATTAHEALHCFGLDHCITWQCLMNSHQVDEHEFLFLSPLNLKKLVYAILTSNHCTKGKDDIVANRYVLDRYHALGDVLKSLDFSKDAAWAYRKASLVEQVTITTGGGEYPKKMAPSLKKKRKMHSENSKQLMELRC
mmetsp:Transcript_33893/g.82195  ORF Transcript_33893/g.82195 Transcript_33893/m.82195 type:complete len:247 (-) Transcript_33893:2819-3559(-)